MLRLRPLKRSDAFAPLSRDHQHGLYAALRLRRADAATVAAAVEHFQRFFADEGNKHFEIEEALVLPALPSDDPEWSAGVTRVVEDHTVIRQAAAAFDATTPREEANALGEHLNDHIRFEERQLFEILERRLGTDALKRLGKAIAEAELEP